MNNTHLDQAKEWADHHAHTELVLEGSAARVIQSLPDHWIDAEKVAKLADDMANWSLPDMPSTTESDCRHLIEIMGGFADRINNLLAPPLPTLADMDEDARHALVGKDVKVEGWNNPSMLIAVHKDEGAVLGHNWINPWPFVEVRPLSELTPVDTAPDQQVNSSEPPKSSLSRPEDVPAGEPWIVEHDGHRWVGTRESRVETVCSWTLARLDGADYTVARDDEITLVSRLVPEDKP